MRKPRAPEDVAKQAAGRGALEAVEVGMRLGLGTGSTADGFTRALGEALRTGRLSRIVAVPTSLRTGKLAEKERIPLATLDEAGWLDLTVDGADELDPRLRLIKGGGGALLQEKIVACASDRMIVVADESKRVATLGAFPLPLEVVPFGWETTRAIVERLLEDQDVGGRAARLRLDRDRPFVTDGGHFILDLELGRIGEPERLSAALNAVPGVIDTGLFLNVADEAVIGRADGSTERLEAG